MAEQIERIKEKDMKFGNLDSICDFNFIDAVDFISYALTMSEGEPYSALVMNLTDSSLNIPLYVTTQISVYDIEKERVCLIASSRNNEQVERIYSKGMIDNSEELRRVMGEEKYILLRPSQILKLYDWRQKKVPDVLARPFPSLEPIIYDLVNFRSSNPDMPQVRLLNTILEKEKTKYSNNGANEK